MTLKAPYPWFGGKSKIMREVWKWLGDTPNFVDPFLGSGASVLGRPPFDGNRIETVNDADGHVCNFWRALQADPEAVAHHADWPVSELDSHARGDWLFYRPDAKEWVEQLRSDPDYYDAKSAGWWVWFVSTWIGGLPSMDKPQTSRGGTKRQLPHLGNAGVGVMRTGGISRQRPHLGDAGRGVMRQPTGTRREYLLSYMAQLAARFDRVRVCCGDWSRVTGPAVTVTNGLTAVFLDPPYSNEADRAGDLYSVDNLTVAHDVREWAIANGDNPLMRIALCGYDSEHESLMPDTWSVYRWKASGGYGSQSNGRGRDNKSREVIWFSPHCLNPNKEKEWRLFDLEVQP